MLFVREDLLFVIWGFVTGNLGRIADGYGGWSVGGHGGSQVGLDVGSGSGFMRRSSFRPVSVWGISMRELLVSGGGAGRFGWGIVFGSIGVLLGPGGVSAEDSGGVDKSPTMVPAGFVTTKWGNGPALNVVVEEKDVGQVPVVLLPGWPQTWLAWRHVAPELADRFHVVVVDPPGIGGSDLMPDRRYDTHAVADAIDAALHGGGITRPYHLIAHDVGSWIALPLAVRHSDDVRTLTLMDAAIPGVTPDEVFSIENNARLFQFYLHAVEELPEMLTAGREREYFDFLFDSKTVVKDAIPDRVRQAYADAYQREGRMTAGFEYYRAVLTDREQNRRIESVPMPVLTLGGDGSTGDGMLRAMRPKIAPHAVGGAIEDCGHYIPEERPDEVVRRWVRFIEDAEGESDE